MAEELGWELLIRGRLVAQGLSLAAIAPPEGEDWAVQPMARASSLTVTAAILPLLWARGFTRLSLKGATDEALLPLSAWPGLTALSLRSPLVSDLGLESLAGQAQLEQLDLTETGVRGPGLEQLRGLSALKELRLSRAPLLLDEAMPRLAALTGLRVLHLAHTNQTGAGLSALSALVHLEQLNLAGSRPGPGGLSFLTALPRLRHLDLSGDEGLEDEDLAALSGLHALRELTLRGRHGIVGAGLRHLSALPALEELDLGGCGIEHTQLPHLRTLPLRRLSLAHCPLWRLEELRERLLQRSHSDLPARMLLSDVWQERFEFRWEAPGESFGVEESTDETTPILAFSEDDLQPVPDSVTPYQRLRRLMEGAEVYEVDLRALTPPCEGVKALGAMQQLRVLDLSDTPVQGEELKGLAWPQLSLLSLANVPLGTLGLAGLGPLPSLRVLDVSGWGSAGLPQGLERLSGVVGLRLGGGQLGAADLLRLIQLPDLRSLGVAESTLWDDALRPLANCGSLEQLSLYRCTLEGVALEALGRSRSLKELDLSRCALGPSERAALGTLGNLRYLNLAYTQIDDSDLPALEQLGDLEWLGVAITGLSREGAARLVAALPDVTVAVAFKPPGSN